MGLIPRQARNVDIRADRATNKARSPTYGAPSFATTIMKNQSNGDVAIATNDAAGAEVKPELLVLTESYSERFWSNVRKSPESDGCWIWTGGRNKRGYGQLTVFGRTQGAHRISYQIHKGKIPSRLFVCHNCPSGDNPLCQNPDHLWLGTHQDNMRDRNQKGRQASGDRSGARLHPETIRRGDNHPFRLNPGLMSRGDNHWTRRHPEKLARGDRSGARTHPEKWKRGPNHWKSKLNEQQVHEIRRLAEAGDLSKMAIGRMFGIRDTLVHKIWRRQLWKHLPDNITMGTPSSASAD